MVNSSLLGTLPKTRTLNIHANVIEVRMTTGKVDAILAATTAKLKNNRLGSIEHLTVPITLNRMILQKKVLATAGQNLVRRRLKQTLESLVLCEFLKFTVSHFPL